MAASAVDSLVDGHGAPPVHDWTQTYRKFEDFEDPEDAETDKKKRERSDVNRSMTGCSHDHSAERAIWEMPWNQKMEACRNFRAEGNYYFREAQFGRAASRYHRALTYLEYCVAETDQEEHEYDDARTKTHLNFALCMKRLKKYGEALNHLTQTCKYDAGNMKAIYHQAQIHRLMDHFQQSKDMLEKLLALQPENVAGKREMAILKSQIHSYEKQSRSISETMFQTKSNPTSERCETASAIQGKVEDEMTLTDMSWVLGSDHDRLDFVKTTKLLAKRPSGRTGEE